MSLMSCPKYGAVECAGGVCFVCGGIGDEEPLRCPPSDEVLQIDTVLGWEMQRGSIARRPTTLTTVTVLKPKRDARESVSPMNERNE